jgi:hypothetical protein
VDKQLYLKNPVAPERPSVGDFYRIGRTDADLSSPYHSWQDVKIKYLLPVPNGIEVEKVEFQEILYSSREYLSEEETEPRFYWNPTGVDMVVDLANKLVGIEQSRIYPEGIIMGLFEAFPTTPVPQNALITNRQA